MYFVKKKLTVYYLESTETTHTHTHTLTHTHTHTHNHRHTLMHTFLAQTGAVEKTVFPVSSPAIKIHGL